MDSSQLIQKVKELYDQRRSYKEIGQMLGLSKGQVAGICFRNKWKRQGARASPTAGPEPARIHKGVSAGVPNTRPSKAKPMPVPPPSPPVYKPLPMVMPEHPPEPPKPLEAVQIIKSVKSGPCQWPVNKEGEPFAVCGDPTSEGTRYPYCETHAKIGRRDSSIKVVKVNSLGYLPR